MYTYFWKMLTLILLSQTLPLNHLHSQTDSSAESFFPLSVGDTWHYQYSLTLGYQTTITSDSINLGDHYLFFDQQTMPSCKVDTSLNVYYSPFNGNYRELRYKLRAKEGETWVAEKKTGVQIRARVESIYWGVVLNTVTQIKRIGYYYQQNDTSNYSSWRNDNYIAAGLGFWWQTTEGMSSSAVELYGCLINGNKYGVLTNVIDNQSTGVLNSHLLYPAFPNPFNPSTNIRYHIKGNDYVTIKIYDILGKEVVTLINEYQLKGDHHIEFRPTNISSGIYLVRLIAGNFSQSMKILYSK